MFKNIWLNENFPASVKSSNKEHRSKRNFDQVVPRSHELLESKIEESIFVGCRSSIQANGGYPVHRSAKGTEERRKKHEVRLWMRNPEDLTSGFCALASCLRPWRHPLPVRWFQGVANTVCRSNCHLKFSRAARFTFVAFLPAFTMRTKKFVRRNLMFHERVQFLWKRE